MEKGKRTYEPRHLVKRRPWYVAVTDIARTHPRLFAAITIGSYISAVSDFVAFLGAVIDLLLELFDFLVRVVS